MQEGESHNSEEVVTEGRAVGFVALVAGTCLVTKNTAASRLKDRDQRVPRSFMLCPGP